MRVDPDHVAVWGLARDAAKRRRDNAAFEQALHRAARGKAYDTQTGLVFISLREALRNENAPLSARMR